MSRRAGQVTTLQALAGIALVILTVLGITTLSRWLLLPAESLPPFPGASDPLPCPSEADVAATEPITVSSSWLIDCPLQFDGRLVHYEGEVVGAVLRRREYAWLQLNDDPYALAVGPVPAHRQVVGGNSGMPVAVPLDVADAITVVGGHRAHGDLVAVTGRFHHADPLDGGGPAIRAERASVTRGGERLTHDLSVRRLMAAAIFLVLTAVAAAGVVVRSRRR